MEQKFDKYAVITEIEEKLEALAEATGIRRAGLIWSIYQLNQILRSGLSEEDEQHEQKINELIRVIDEQKPEKEPVAKKHKTDE